jgi:hypothetical protein
VTESSVPINGTNPAQSLETAEFTNSNGDVVQREGVFIGSPTNFSAKAEVCNSVPPTNEYGQVVRPIMPMTSFGELSVAENTPIIQSMATYGILDQMTPFNINGGTSTFSDSMYVCSSGTNSDALGGLLTTRQLSYRPGQGISARFTGVFDSPVDGNDQQIGMITATDTAAFGYKDQVFGIIYQHGGKVEIQELTVTGAAGGSENATITVDGTGYTVPLTAGTTEHNAYEIANSLNTQVDDYGFTSNGSTVVARALFAVVAGSFAFTSATATASWSQVTAGQIYTDDFVAQADWDIDTRSTLDPSKGNVFEIKTQFLGFGAIQFFIENPLTGHFELVHIIQYANTAIIPSFTNPTFRIGGISVNRTNTTNVTVKFASVAGFVEGKHESTEASRALDATTASVGTAVFTNILTLRNRIVMDGVRNRVETAFLRAFASADTAKNAIIQITSNADFSGDMDFDYIDKDKSATEFATDTVTVTGGRYIDSFIAPGVGREIDLEKIGTIMEEGETITFSARIISGSAADVSVTTTFLEDF